MEWLTNRELRVKLIDHTAVVDSEILTELEVVELMGKASAREGSKVGPK